MANIIQNFPGFLIKLSSDEYPDCVRDIQGENYTFYSREKILDTFRAIKANDKGTQVVEMANRWADELEKYISTNQPQPTEIKLFNTITLPFLEKASLAYGAEGTGLVAHHTSGWPFDFDNDPDKENVFVVSMLSHQVIRILATQVFWNRHFSRAAVVGNSQKAIASQLGVQPAPVSNRKEGFSTLAQVGVGLGAFFCLGGVASQLPGFIGLGVVTGGAAVVYETTREKQQPQPMPRPSNSAGATPPPPPKKRPEPPTSEVPEDIKNVLHQQIAAMSGTENFKVLSTHIQPDPFRVYGQFVGLDEDENVICDYEMDTRRLTYRMSADQSKAAYYRQKYGQQSAASQQVRPIGALVPGVVIGGKYRIESKLGEGGFGATYIVSDESKNIKNTYVAKLQKLEGDRTVDKELIERFEREAAALQQVGSGHGQIPTLFDYFDEQGNFFLIQEQVKGKSLQSVFVEMAKQGHLMSNAYAIKLTMEILEVVQHLHNQGLIHRDIKPDNIILREGDGKPVLIDFGLIKQTETGVELATGTMAGTPGYMPIEQQMGKALFQSDLFAVGMVFLLLTTGRPPHTLEPDFETLQYDLDWADDYLEKPLLEWLQEAIALRPQDRFGSATEMRQALIDIRDHALRVEGFAKAIEVLGDEGDLSDSAKVGRSTDVDIAAIEKTGSLQAVPSQIGEIVTTQKELDAFNALKRVLERAGRDGNLLEMHDQPDFCDIHYRKHPDQVIARLYFNDEDNLAFAVLKADGSEERYPLNTLRGIAPKSAEILARLEEVEVALGMGRGPAPAKKPEDEYVPDNDEDLVDQEIRPIIVQQLTQMYGPEFELLSIQVEDEPFRIYGQFQGKGAQAHRIFDFEVKQGKGGKLGMTYRLNPDCLAQEEAAEAAQQQKDDELAKQGVYTVEWLQRNFDSFSAAKDHFGIRARSWQKLADALSQQKQG